MTIMPWNQFINISNVNKVLLGMVCPQCINRSYCIGTIRRGTMILAEYKCPRCNHKHTEIVKHKRVE